MSVSISGTTITMTKGDTLKVTINPSYQDGASYVPENGDSIRFAMKQKVTDDDCLIIKEIPLDTMLLHLAPEETKSLPYGIYCYDIQLTHANGDVDTFITKSVLKLTEEVE